MKKNSDKSILKFCIFVFYAAIFLSVLPLIFPLIILFVALASKQFAACWGAYVLFLATIFFPILNIKFLLEPVKLLLLKLKKEDFNFSRDEIITITQINIFVLLVLFLLIFSLIFKFVQYNIRGLEA